MPDKKFLLPGAAALSFFVWGSLGVMLGPVLPGIAAELDLSDSQSGLIFLIWSSGFVVGPMAVGHVLHRVGISDLLVGLSLIAAGCCAAIAVAPAYPWLLCAYGVAGLCGGSVFTASHTLFGVLFPDRRSSALSGLDLTFSLGNLAAPLSVAALFALGGTWQHAYFFLAAGFTVVALVFVASRTPRSDPLPVDRPSKASSGAARSGVVAILCSRPGVLLALAAFSLGAVEWLQHVWFVSYAEALGTGPENARFAMALFIGGMIMVRVAALVLGPRMKSRAFMVFSMLGIVVGTIMIVAMPRLGAPTFESIGAGGFLLGAGIGAVFPLILGAAMDEMPAAGAGFSAIVVSGVTIGGQVAAVSTGLISDLTDRTIAYGTLAFFAVLLISAMTAFFRSISAGPRRG